MSAAAIKEVLASNPFISKQDLFMKANVLESRGVAILSIMVERGSVICDKTGRTHLYALPGATKPDPVIVTDEEILAFASEKTFAMSDLEKEFPDSKDLRDRVGALVIGGKLFHNEKIRNRRYSASKELLDSEKEADRRS